MDSEELERKARELQISCFKWADCGHYKVKRPLFYAEALEQARQDIAGLNKWQDKGE